MKEMGITIDDIHSSDFGLHLKAMSIPLAEVKSNVVEVPGTSAIIDLTESLTGQAEYRNRTISFTFGIASTFEEWALLIQRLASKYHGKICHIVLDSDPGYFYKARLRINNEKTSRVIGEVVIEGDADPYKYEIYSTGDEWRWDPFNFEEDIIEEALNLTVTEGFEFTLLDIGKAVAPDFIVTSSNNLSVEYRGRIYRMPTAGTYRFPSIRITEYFPTLLFHGTGIVTIDYRKAIL